MLIYHMGTATKLEKNMRCCMIDQLARMLLGKYFVILVKHEKGHRHGAKILGSNKSENKAAKGSLIVNLILKAVLASFLLH